LGEPEGYLSVFLDEGNLSVRANGVRDYWCQIAIRARGQTRLVEYTNKILKPREKIRRNGQRASSKIAQPVRRNQETEFAGDPRSVLVEP
jgi:hypothetical protein